LLRGAAALTGGLALAPVLSACSSSSSGAASKGIKVFTPPASSTKLSDYQKFNPNVPAGPATGLPKRIATNFPAGSAYFQDFQKIVEKAAKDRGYEFVATTWSTDLAKNINQLETLMASGVGALVCQVQDEHGQAATLQKAINQGICVFYEVAGPCTCEIISNQYQTGYIQGVQAAKWITANLGGKAQVVVFNDDKVAQSLIPRGQGRVAGVKTAGPGVQVVANQSMTQLTAEEGTKLANTLLQAHPGANVWLGDDDTSIGVVAALEASGKTASDKIYVSGFNGQLNALQAVKAGGLFREDIAFANAVYEYAAAQEDIAFANAVYEYAAAQAACDWIEGKSIPQVMNLGIFPVDPTNVDAFLADNSDPANAYKSGIAKYVDYYGNTDFRTRTYVPGAVST
jgi:ribose transport system substrate-binding protein